MRCAIATSELLRMPIKWASCESISSSTSAAIVHNPKQIQCLSLNLLGVCTWCRNPHRKTCEVLVPRKQKYELWQLLSCLAPGPYARPLAPKRKGERVYQEKSNMIVKQLPSMCLRQSTSRGQLWTTSSEKSQLTLGAAALRASPTKTLT